MRINKDIRFPYPVLGVGNSFKTSLSASDRTIVPTQEGTTFIFKITVSMPSKDILDYIHDGFAEFSFELNCPATYYREIRTSDLPEISFSVSDDQLNKTVEFNCFVVAKKPIKDYKNKDLTQKYPASIDYDKGELLAIYPPFTLPLSLSLGNLRNPVSLMRIEEKPSYDSMEFDLLSNKITIYMPTELYQVYHPMPKEKKKHAVKAVAVSAMTYALLNLQKGLDDNLDWAVAIKFKIEANKDEYDFDIEDVLLAKDDEDGFNKVHRYAQIILNDPYSSIIGLMKELDISKE